MCPVDRSRNGWLSAQDTGQPPARPQSQTKVEIKRWESLGKGRERSYTATEHLLLESSTQDTSGSSYFVSPKEWGVPVGIRKNPQLSWGDVTL